MKTFCATLLLLAASLPLALNAETSTKQPLPSCCGSLSIFQEKSSLPDNSIYQIGSNWLNQEGQEIPIKALSGRVQVMAMIYTSCKFACPRIMADIKAIEDKIPEKLHEQVGFTLISMDPQRDTPPVLKAFSRKWALDPAQWTLLHGKSDDVLELAALLGVRYKQTPNGEFSHSNIISILTAEGAIAYQQTGLGADSTESISRIQQLLQQSP